MNRYSSFYLIVLNFVDMSNIFKVGI